MRIFLGDRKSRRYGTKTTWRNSQSFLLGEQCCIPNELNNLDWENGRRIDTQTCNCAIFDSRLFHQSLPHTQHEHLVSLTFCLSLNGVKLHPLDTSGYIDPEECIITDLSQYI